MEHLIVGLSFLTLTTAGPSWSYHGNNGPSKWATSYPKCGGQKQSPIDIQIPKVEFDAALGGLALTGYNSPPSSMSMKNTEYTVNVYVTGTMALSGGGLSATYNLAQFHLHWGATSSKGSEHTINGNAYPAEIHFVHYNSIYNGTSEALSQPGGLAVLGFFLQGGGTTHAGFQKILNQLPSIQFAGDNISVATFAMTDILPSDLAKYIRYPGSLTTPTCDETVTWTVFPDPLVVSNAQLNTLRTSLFTDSGPGNVTNVTTAFPYTYIQDNYRPVQALNGRKVTSSVQLTSTASISETSLASLLLILLTFKLIMS